MCWQLPAALNPEDGTGYNLGSSPSPGFITAAPPKPPTGPAAWHAAAEER